MDCPYSKQQSNHGIMVEEAEANLLDSISSSSSQGFGITSSESDFTEEFISSASSSLPEQQLAYTDTLHDMSSLLQQLPKRGLSKHYHGKSESFTSLSNVRCMEDLAKPDNPYAKRLKLWKRFGGLSETHKPCPPNIFSKKASRGSRSSFAKSGSFLGNRLPIPPQSS